MMDMNMETPTTRSHPRTLNEAFPSGTEYAAAIERYRRIDYDGIIIAAVCLTFVFIVLGFFWSK